MTVAAKAITVTPDSGQSKVYGASDPTLHYTANPALESGDGFTGALGRAVGENVGSYAITLGNLSAGSNYALSLSTSAGDLHGHQEGGDGDRGRQDQGVRVG